MQIACMGKQQPRFYWSCLSVEMKNATPLTPQGHERNSIFKCKQHTIQLKVISSSFVLVELGPEFVLLTIVSIQHTFLHSTFLYLYSPRRLCIRVALLTTTALWWLLDISSAWQIKSVYATNLNLKIVKQILVSYWNILFCKSMDWLVTQIYNLLFNENTFNM